MDQTAVETTQTSWWDTISAWFTRFLDAAVHSEWTSLIVLGLFVGLIIGVIMRGRGFGMIGNLVVGMVGALLGPAIFRLFHLRLGLGTYRLDIDQLVMALTGAAAFLVLAGVVRKREQRRAASR